MKSIDERIKTEEKRIRAIFADMPEQTRAVVDGLIQRAAYMRVTLEDYEADIIKNGSTERFTQSSNTPAYDRQRPVAQLYAALSKLYQTCIKQLTDQIKPDQDPGENDLVKFMQTKPVIK